MPASNNVKYRAVPRLHPPPSLGDSQSKTFGNSQTHPEPLHRIASLMRLSSPFWRRTKTPCMFAPLSSSTTASATVPQRATRLEKLLHENPIRQAQSARNAKRATKTTTADFQSTRCCCSRGTDPVEWHYALDQTPSLARASLWLTIRRGRPPATPLRWRLPLHHNLDYENSLFCSRLQSLTLSTPLVTCSG